MPISLFDLFSIGIGPSSSHTVGPMRAARVFARYLDEKGLLSAVVTLKIDLFGSLAMTGLGHGTDKALFLGLEGHTPEGVDPNAISGMLAFIYRTSRLNLLGKHPITFVPDDHLIFNKGKRLPYHSNAIRFVALDAAGQEIVTQIYYSTGGGFIIEHEEIHLPPGTTTTKKVPYPYETYADLHAHCCAKKKKIYEIVLENEKSFRTEKEIREGILNIWSVMQGSVHRGLHQTGELPGGLHVKRRAANLYAKLKGKEELPNMLDWISMYALAVNEENAAGGRVVTAPTNGAAGVLPAVLYYYQQFTDNPTEEGIIRYFLTAAALGILYKKGASISAAEMGCQGEVGVACSMAAGALTAALGGTNEQIENAAEIGMEHNLGLTCDPIAGLVQIPCIERNCMGAVQAITAMRLALASDGSHRVSLDQVIRTMRSTGEDMKSSYKETSEAGLALHVPVNLPEC